MKFGWGDYLPETAPFVESWLDDEAKKYAGCDDGFAKYYDYWKSATEHNLGCGFCCKLFFYDEKPIGVIALGEQEGIFTIMEYIIAPELRGKGYGSAALCELLSESRKIIGRDIDYAEAVIFLNNIYIKY